MSIKENIKRLIDIIGNETNLFANTHTRIGEVLIAILNFFDTKVDKDEAGKISRTQIPFGKSDSDVFRGDWGAALERNKVDVNLINIDSGVISDKIGLERRWTEDSNDKLICTHALMADTNDDGVAFLGITSNGLPFVAKDNLLDNTNREEILLTNLRNIDSGVISDKIGLERRWTEDSNDKLICTHSLIADTPDDGAAFLGVTSEGTAFVCKNSLNGKKQEIALSDMSNIQIKGKNSKLKKSLQPNTVVEIRYNIPLRPKNGWYLITQAAYEIFKARSAENTEIVKTITIDASGFSYFYDCNLLGENSSGSIVFLSDTDQVIKSIILRDGTHISLYPDSNVKKFQITMSADSFLRINKYENVDVHNPLQFFHDSAFVKSRPIVTGDIFRNLSDNKDYVITELPSVGNSFVTHFEQVSPTPINFRYYIKKRVRGVSAHRFAGTKYVPIQLFEHKKLSTIKKYGTGPIPDYKTLFPNYGQVGLDGIVNRYIQFDAEKERYRLKTGMNNKQAKLGRRCCFIECLEVGFYGKRKRKRVSPKYFKIIVRWLDGKNFIVIDGDKTIKLPSIISERGIKKKSNTQKNTHREV